MEFAAGIVLDKEAAEPDKRDPFNRQSAAGEIELSPTQTSAATVKDEESISGALEEILLEITGSKIEPGQSLVRSGILDSLKVVELIAKVEDRFSIELSGNDLEIGNFETLDALSALITRKREAR